MFVVMWLRHSGLELKEAHAFESAEDAAKKFCELDRAIVKSPFNVGIYGAEDLKAGRKLVSAYGTDDVIHAVKV